MPPISTIIDHVVTAEEHSEATDDVQDALVQQPRPGDAPSEDEACGPVVGFDDLDADEGGHQVEHVGALRGIPLLYGRDGHPHHPRPRQFPVDGGFRDRLERTVAVVQARAPEQFGELRSITSAGMLVKKPDSLHASGRACDWDSFTFAHLQISPFFGDHKSPSHDVRRRYWALAALCRSTSAYVLHAEFNAAHTDHIHQDNGAALAFDPGSPTTVKLVQALCNEVFDQTPALRIDGVFGQDTRDALVLALRVVGLDGSVTQLATWRKFLRRAGRLGFHRSV